jgi:uncharacterized protein (DUF779 family)
MSEEDIRTWKYLDVILTVMPGDTGWFVDKNLKRMFYNAYI